MVAVEEEREGKELQGSWTTLEVQTLKGDEVAADVQNKKEFKCQRSGRKEAEVAFKKQELKAVDV